MSFVGCFEIAVRRQFAGIATYNFHDDSTIVQRMSVLLSHDIGQSKMKNKKWRSVLYMKAFCILYNILSVHVHSSYHFHVHSSCSCNLL